MLQVLNNTIYQPSYFALPHHRSSIRGLCPSVRRIVFVSIKRDASLGLKEVRQNSYYRIVRCRFRLPRPLSSRYPQSPDTPYLIEVLQGLWKGVERVSGPGMRRVVFDGGEEVFGPDGARGLTSGHVHGARQSQHQNTVQLLALAGYQSRRAGLSGEEEGGVGGWKFDRG